MQKYLDIILNKQVSNIGRAGNMLWLQITNEEKDSKEACGDNSLLLHVQSAWRVTNRKTKTILFAASDMYMPNSLQELSDDFCWDIQGNNLFDEKSIQWINNNSPIIINEYRLNRWGDLLIIFSNGDSMEIFVDSSDDTECWRLFQHNCENAHFIICGLGQVIED